jgi:hypothetical protein
MGIRKGEIMPKDTVRVSLDLSEQFHKRLTELEELTHAESKAGVIRQALQLYEYVARRTMQGYTFIAVDKNGQQEKLVFFSPYIAEMEPENAGALVG